MKSFDIVAWHFDGAIYCDDCVDDKHKVPEYYEGWGGPVFADDEGWQDACCGTCGHSFGCIVGDHEAACFPCEVEQATDAVRTMLAELPAGVRRAAIEKMAAEAWPHSAPKGEA